MAWELVAVVGRLISREPYMVGVDFNLIRDCIKKHNGQTWLPASKMDPSRGPHVVLLLRWQAHVIRAVITYCHVNMSASVLYCCASDSLIDHMSVSSVPLHVRFSPTSQPELAIVSWNLHEKTRQPAHGQELIRPVRKGKKKVHVSMRWEQGLKMLLTPDAIQVIAW